MQNDRMVTRFKTEEIQIAIIHVNISFLFNFDFFGVNKSYNIAIMFKSYQSVTGMKKKECIITKMIMKKNLFMYLFDLFLSCSGSSSFC